MVTSAVIFGAVKTEFKPCPVETMLPPLVSQRILAFCGRTPSSESAILSPAFTLQSIGSTRGWPAALAIPPQAVSKKMGDNRIRKQRLHIITFRAHRLAPAEKIQRSGCKNPEKPAGSKTRPRGGGQIQD